MPQQQSSSYNEITDTHLAKKYNDLLFDCMMRCNMTGYVNQSIPHYDNLLMYFAAINALFKNTYVLFVNVIMDKQNTTLTTMLRATMKDVKHDMNLMKTKAIYRSPGYFEKVANKCDNVHEMIIFGLQRRKMLVRTSEAEPRGQDSINYWKDKKGFTKGGLPSAAKRKHEYHKLT